MRRRITPGLVGTCLGGVLLVSVLLLALTQNRVGDTENSIITTGKKLYSQNDEELIIRHFFGDRRGGFFLDVGCYQWKELSTTYYLEKHLGWSGIGIDANAALAPGYKRHRPRTRFLNYLVTDHSGDPEIFYLVDGLEGISSASKEFILQMYRDFAPNSEPRIHTVEVPTRTLNELLAQQGVEKIDFMSIDIEGNEPLALAGFDIERFQPELVCAEVSGNGEVLMRYFEQHGYERIDAYLPHDPANWYFQPR